MGEQIVFINLWHNRDSVNVWKLLQEKIIDDHFQFVSFRNLDALSSLQIGLRSLND